MHEDDISAASQKLHTLSKRENSSSSESIFHGDLRNNCSRVGESSNYSLVEATRHFPFTSQADNQTCVSKAGSSRSNKPDLDIKNNEEIAQYRYSITCKKNEKNCGTKTPSTTDFVHLFTCAGDTQRFADLKDEESSSQSDSQLVRQEVKFHTKVTKHKSKGYQIKPYHKTSNSFSKSKLKHPKKHIIISDQEFSESCEDDSLVGITTAPTGVTWNLENRECRRKLNDELATYKQKLISYQEGQQRQANLVQRLQGKVLQYKEKCRTLELKLQLAEAENQNRKVGLEENTAEYEATLGRLEEEQQRASTLASVNTMLREQLDQITQANQALSSENQRTREEAARLKEHLERREAEWRDEEAAFNDYFTMEHGRLLTLWRAVVACRRQFVEVKGQVEREINSARADVSRMARISQTACENFATNLRAIEAQNQSSLEWERTEKKKIERHLEELTHANESMRQQLDTGSKTNNKQLQELSTELEETKRQLADREKAIASLQRLRTGQSLCGRKEGSDINDPQARALVEEVQSMQQALRDLAQAVINEDPSSTVGLKDCCGRSRSRSPVYASGPGLVFSGSHVSRAGAYGRTGSPPPPVNSTGTCYWGDSTMSAVQAALTKRGMQLSDMGSKLSNVTSQYEAIRAQLEDSENERRNLEHQLLRMRTDLDSRRRERDEASRDLERCKSSLQTTTNDKNELEKARASLMDQVKNLQMSLERTQNAYEELQKHRERMEEELTNLNRDEEKSRRENDRCQRCIESLEERLSAAREEGTSLRESLQCARLEAEIKATERADLQESLAKCEARRVELEAEVLRLRNEQTVLNERLTKQQSKLEDMHSKRQLMQGNIRSLETDFAQLSAEFRAVEADKASLREALSQMEAQKNEVSSEKNTLHQSLTLSEAARERLEDEISRLNREKIDVTEQLNAVTRHKNGLANELTQKSRDIDRLREVIARLGNEKEDICREKGELLSQLRACERECCQVKELLASTKKEHQNLEADYYHSKQQLIQLETKCDLLANENQELNIKKANLLSDSKRAQTDLQQEIERITQARDQIVQQSQCREQELQAALRAAKEASENEFNALRHQMVEARQVADGQTRDLIAAHKVELEEAKRRLEKEKETHSSEIMSLQRERDEASLAAEAEKQAILSACEQERASLSERIVSAYNQIKALEAELERIKREAQARHERDEAVKNELTQELKEFRKHFEETCNFHEQNAKELQTKIAEVATQRDDTLRELDELQVQMKLLEETRENLQRSFMETTCRLRNTDEARETLRKEIIDLRRAVSETQRERDTFAESKAQLAKRVKDLETEKVEQARLLNEEKQRVSVLEEQKCVVGKEVSELRSGLRDSEKARLDTRRDLQETRRQLKETHVDRERQSKDIAELQARLAREEEKCEGLRQENSTLKQKLGELDATRSSLRKELASAERRIADLQESLASRERESKQAMDHASCEHRRLTEVRNQLQIGLEAVSADAADLRLALNDTEAKLASSESRLGRSEEIRREMEYKLGSIHSSLRRLIGYRQSRRGKGVSGRKRCPASRSPTKTVLDMRSPEASRQASPKRDMCSEPTKENGVGPSDNICGDGVGNSCDLDPESVRHALHEFVQRYTDVKRDMEDAHAQIQSLQARLHEQAEQTEQWARRLHQLQQALCDAEADKKGIDGRLSSTQTALMLQEETLRKNERDRKQMAEKISMLERQLAASESARRDDQEKLNRIRQCETRLEEEQRLSRRALEEAENRVTQLEVTRRALEGELQRIKMCLMDKENENQTLQDRIANLCKQIQDLESKSQSLQVTVDRLSVALSKSEELESASKDKMQQLNMNLNDQNQTIQVLQERLNCTQKALTGSEQDRRIAQERLDNAKAMIHEQKHQNQQLTDRLQCLQNELNEADLRKTESENQNRHINGMLHKHQQSELEISKKLQAIVHEKQELQERVASLQRLLADTETARDQLAKSSSHLEKDRQSLRRHLEKVEREKVQREEILSKENLDRTELEITLRRLEEENLDQKRQVQYLQARLGEIEQMHAQRLIEASKQNRAETELEMERLRNCQIQAERALEARERAHRQRVRALEEQVVKLKVKMTTIKDQLAAESRKRQQLQNTKPNLSRHSELPLYGSSRDVRRLLDDSVMCIKPNQSSTDLASKTRCPGSEKLTAFDRHRSGSRGLRMPRK
ncbi:Rootletin [Paragonimus heterotremus]|uniref:Rootletin n=1 Tax=Paragonimus heterotremus TaxID=100268 RepID=A0A8J4SLE2_9TREM|nr:Rootletin [Paragonimus heterotremus]